MQNESLFESDTQFRIARKQHAIHGNTSAPKIGLYTIRKGVEWKEKNACLGKNVGHIDLLAGDVGTWLPIFFRQ